MKLSFNKQPVDKTDTNQLNLFKNDFKIGDFVYILTSKKFGIIMDINTDYDVVKVKTYQEEETFLSNIIISTDIQNLIPARIEPILVGNRWADFKIGDICTYEINADFFVKIWAIADSGKPIFFGGNKSANENNSYYKSIYILRK